MFWAQPIRQICRREILLSRSMSLRHLSGGRGEAGSSQGFRTKHERAAPPANADREDFTAFSPRLCVIGVGGGGSNAVENMISRNLKGVDFMVCNTDAQHLSKCHSPNRIQLGKDRTRGLGCGADPDAGKVAAIESEQEIQKFIEGASMVFITAGMGGGTGTGAAPVIAEMCLKQNILTVAVVTRPFMFEGRHRARLADEGIEILKQVTDTLIVIPNQNLLKLTSDNTTMLESFRIADDILLAGVRSVTDLMVEAGLINLDFADVQAVMKGMGTAIMGSAVAEGEDRALIAAEDALKNPLLGDLAVKTAKGMLVNITGGPDITLTEVERAATAISKQVEDESANIQFGATIRDDMKGKFQISIVATGIEEAPDAKEPRRSGSRYHDNDHHHSHYSR